MKRILIIEDEEPARKKLRRFLDELGDDIDIVAEIDTVARGIDFLSTHQVDIIFSDIELLDGNAFDIYRVVAPSSPIIFVTAYDQFWMNAFDSNGIDYLLKPYSKERFQKAWNKCIHLTNPVGGSQLLLNEINSRMMKLLEKREFKGRFTVHQQRSMYFLETGDIVLFEANEGVVFAFDRAGKKHILNETTLKEIEEQINPEEFFRLNRSEMVNKAFIERVVSISKNVLTIHLKGLQRQLSTSQQQTAEFRKWIEQ